jgi:hypothetical protein
MTKENPIFRQLANKIAAGEPIDQLLEIQREYALHGVRGSMSPEDFQALDRLKIRHMTRHGSPPAPDYYDSVPNASDMERDDRVNTRRRRSDRQAIELKSEDSLIFRDDSRPKTALETHAHTGGTLLAAGSRNATHATARRYPSHRHIVDPTTGERVGSEYSAPEDGHVVGKEGQLDTKPSPNNDGVMKARQATRNERAIREASRRVKEETSEWEMSRGTSGASHSDAYDDRTYTDDFPTVQNLALALQDATTAAANLKSNKPIIDLRGRHKKSILEAENRVRELQEQIDEKKKAAAMAKETARAAENKRKPSLFERFFGSVSSPSPSSTEQSNTTISANPQGDNGSEMSESDAQTIRDYIGKGYTYEGVKGGYHVLRKGQDVVNITA